VLTAKEKRFIRSWEEQRKGGKWAYFLLYIPAGTFIFFIIAALIMMAFFLEFPGGVWMLVLYCLLLMTIVIIINWIVNENRFKSIIRREIKEAQRKDSLNPGNGPSVQE
jgi:protein-S-isoprenylcysteine O-methyltransferase Ste14